MELSGEVLAGVFFEAIPGLQFASHDAFRDLKRPSKRAPIYWLNAADPISLCGIGLDAFKGKLPKRLASTRIVYRGDELVAEILRNGKALAFYAGTEDVDIGRIFEGVRHLLTRTFNPLRSIHLETINDEDARSSPYLETLEANFRLHSDHKRVVIEGVK